MENKKPAKKAESALQKKQGIGEHLIAMRRMIVVIAGAVIVCLFLVYSFLAQHLVDFILSPVMQRGIAVISTRVSESLMMRIKTSFVASLVLCMPIIIWQVWGFVGPALYPNEKKAVKLLFLIMVLLFVVGIVFAYLTVFPMTIDLFYEASEGVATPMWSVEGYFNFVLSFILPFGLMFELPVVIFILARKGKVTGEAMSRNRKYFILAAAVIAAILTPPDVVSQTMLLIPILLLYEISVLIAKKVKPQPVDEAAAVKSE